MKIILVADHVLGDSGWSRYGRDLATGLIRKGHTVLFVVEKIMPMDSVEQRVCLIDPLKYVANPIQAFLSAQKVNKVIAEFEPDIIQFCVEPYSTMIPFLKLGKAKIVLNAHSTFAYLPILVKGIKRKLLEWYTPFMYRKLHAVIPLSEYTKQHLITHMTRIGAMKYIENKMHLVGGAIDLKVFPPHHTPKNNMPKKIIMVGMIKPRKGVLESINALQYVKTDFIYNIIGSFKDGDGYVAVLRNRIKELGFEKKVFLLGRQDHDRLRALYEESDLFLMLSTNNGADFEGYGLVYLEANSYGIPCIGPNDSGVSDAIVDGKTGYIVNQFDPKQVAQKIDAVLQGNTIFPEACLDWARKNSIEHQAEQFLKIYSTLTA